MLTVLGTDTSIGTDYDSVCNESTLDNGTCFNNNTRHQDTVDDLGTRTDLDACEKYGVGDLAFYNTALSNESSVDHSGITDILWKRGSILSVDFPGRIVKIQFTVRTEKIHIASQRESMVPTSFQ